MKNVLDLLVPDLGLRLCGIWSGQNSVGSTGPHAM